MVYETLKKGCLLLRRPTHFASWHFTGPDREMPSKLQIQNDLFVMTVAVFDKLYSQGYGLAMELNKISDRFCNITDAYSVFATLRKQTVASCLQFRSVIAHIEDLQYSRLSQQP